MAFRTVKSRSTESDESFKGDLKSYDEFSAWMTDKCVPLVREITFENAEELTEEGLPFLILFYDPDDTHSIKKYNDIINRELLDEKRNSIPSLTSFSVANYYLLLFFLILFFRKYQFPDG